MDRAYISAATSATQRRHKCLGLTLEPLTVGHLFILLELQSPFITGDQETFEDFLIAVFVCANTHTQSRKNLKRWWCRLFFRVWGYANRKADIVTELLLFRAYLAEQMSVPVYRKDQSGQAPSAPVPYQVLASLMTEFCVSEADAMRMRVNHANCLCAAAAELRGTLQAQDESFRELWEYAAEQDAAMPKEGEKS